MRYRALPLLSLAAVLIAPVSARAITAVPVPDSVALGEIVSLVASGGTDAELYGANNCGGLPWVCSYYGAEQPDTDGPNVVSMRMIYGSTRYQYATEQLPTTTRPFTYITTTECWPTAAASILVKAAPNLYSSAQVEFGVIDGCREISGHVYDLDGNPIPDFLILLSAIENKGGSAGNYGDGYLDTGMAGGFHVMKTDAGGFWSAVVPNVYDDGYFGDPAAPFVGYRVIPLQRSFFTDGVISLGQFYPFDYKVDLEDPAQLVDRDFYLLPAVTGHILDLKGRAIQGITLYGTALGGGSGFGSASTNNDGAYRMRLPEGTYRIEPSMPESGIIEPTERFVDVLVGGVSPIADFTYLAYRLSGYVRDESQAGVSSVEMTFTRPVDGYFKSTFTDDDGYYEITLKRGVYEVAPIDPDDTDGVPVTPTSRIVNLETDDGFADFQVGSNPPPVADFTYEVDPDDDLHYTFDSSASSDNDPIPELGYRWLINGEFQEGKIVEYWFPNDGEFGVGLVVTDEDGALGEKSITVNVGARLSAALSISDSAPKSGEYFDINLVVKNESDSVSVADVTPSLVSVDPSTNVFFTTPQFDPESAAALAPGVDASFRLRARITDTEAHEFRLNATGFVGTGSKQTDTLATTVTPTLFDPVFHAVRDATSQQAAVESAPDPEFPVVDEVMKTVRTGNVIRLLGTSWDPDGGPIAVTGSDGQQIGSFPPSPDGSFQGEFDLGQLRRSNTQDLGVRTVCDFVLQAEQDTVRRRVLLLGRAIEKISYAANVVDSRGHPFAAADLVCEGELVYPGSPSSSPIIGGDPYVEDGYEPAADPTNICNIATVPIGYLATPYTTRGVGEGGRSTEIGSEPAFYGGPWWQSRSANGACSDALGIFAFIIFVDGRAVALGPRSNELEDITIGEGWASRPHRNLGPSSVIARFVLIETEAPDPIDSDYDKIRNAIDGSTRNGAFEDQSHEFSSEFALEGTDTSGSIIDRGSQTISADVAASGDQIALVSEETAAPESPQNATLDLCSFPTSVGDSDAANFACGSLILEVLSGPIEVRLGADVEAQIPAGVTATIRRLGDDEYQVSHTGGATLPILLCGPGDVEDQVASGATKAVVSRPDTDADRVADVDDDCPQDFYKTEPGLCGCGLADADTDLDGTLDCEEGCPFDFSKLEPGACGCDEDETDTDGDSTPDCVDGCSADPLKTAAGACGCGVADTDSDGDGAANCIDGCASDPLKTAPGTCGCGVSDSDTDADTVPDCRDNCRTVPNTNQADANGNGVGDACEAPPSGEKTICADLSGFLDVDGYAFDGAKGEKIDAVLRPDPPRTTQKYALLALDDRIPGVTLLRTDAGKLPNAVQATLPKAGRYGITVASFGPGAVAFKGAYCITVRSSGSAAATLR